MRSLQLALMVAVMLVCAAPSHAQVFFSRKPKVNPNQRVPELIVIVKTDADERKRAHAAEELRDYDPAVFNEIVPVLVDVLQHDKKPGVRLEALSSLAKIRPVTAAAGRALEKAAAEDDSVRVRLQARTLLPKYHLAGYLARNSPAPTEKKAAAVPTPAPLRKQTPEPPLSEQRPITVPMAPLVESRPLPIPTLPSTTAPRPLPIPTPPSTTTATPLPIPTLPSTTTATPLPIPIPTPPTTKEPRPLTIPIPTPPPTKEPRPLTIPIPTPAPATTPRTEAPSDRPIPRPFPSIPIPAPKTEPAQGPSLFP